MIHAHAIHFVFIVGMLLIFQDPPPTSATPRQRIFIFQITFQQKKLHSVCTIST